MGYQIMMNDDEPTWIDVQAALREDIFRSLALIHGEGEVTRRWLFDVAFYTAVEMCVQGDWWPKSDGKPVGEHARDVDRHVNCLVRRLRGQSIVDRRSVRG